MNTKKVFQLFVLLAILFASFATTTSAFAAGCGTSVTVVSGDTLRKIAERCGTTVSALRRANPESGNGNLIYPGQALLLPGAILGTDGGYIIYVVARGDTVKSLAIRFSSTVDSIVASNPAITNVNLIYEGHLLTICDLFSFAVREIRNRANIVGAAAGYVYGPSGLPSAARFLGQFEMLFRLLLGKFSRRPDRDPALDAYLVTHAFVGIGTGVASGLPPGPKTTWSTG